MNDTMDQLDYSAGGEVHADMHRCGLGRGAECCLFLTVGGGGPFCARNSSMHQALLNKRPDFSAKRIPEQRWPECMVFPEKP